jgi:FMN phosphatase YigB (HAD superfamily)
MIRVIMFDLGGTLVDGQRPFPHVPEALSAVNSFETADGQPLRSCLVSDFTMADPPDDPAQVEAIFADYLSRLAGFGLAEFFQPPQERITLSTHAGVRKPDRRVYELALRRLGSPAGLPECLVVTEDVAHLAACRILGMSTLRFSAGDDWLDVLLLLRRLVAPASVADGSGTDQ